MKFQLALVALGFACSVFAESPAAVETQIWINLRESDTTNVLVTFNDANIDEAFNRFLSLKLTTRDAKLNAQYAILKDHADTVQADVTRMLMMAAKKGKNHEVSQLWISNELIVRNVDKEVIELLRSHPDVKSLIAEQFIPLEPLTEEGTPIQDGNKIQWGVENVRAPTVWADGNSGEGVVVGIIDTGARVTHVSLAPTYRGNEVDENNNYNWYAPSDKSSTPSDGNGHGTHVIGTICGTSGIGVAPGARWIACRGCSTSSCSSFDLSQCGNWMACPTNFTGGAPDCTKAPNIVSNSWGGGSGDAWYDKIIQAWLNVEVLPVFSAGNSGNKCSTLLSPGDRPGVVGVAAIQQNNQLSSFSSVGPTRDGRISPTIGAPGSNIVSASNADDNGLRTASGTSMAAPHISGVAALILGQRLDATVLEVTDAIIAGGVIHSPLDRACGGIQESVLPNNFIGYGRIDAPNAVNAI